MMAPARLAAVLVLFTLTGVVGPLEAADEVILRTATDKETAWVGERVRLKIEVLGADGWAQITGMGRLEIPGTYVMRTESQGVRTSETVAGTAYTGQRYQLSVFCQRPGRVEIPPIPVTAVVKQWGVNAQETPYELETPVAAFTCMVPPGAESVSGLISTTRLDAEQRWSSTPQTVALGDAVTRTITMRAADVSGMAFPPIKHPEIDGVAVYPGQPSVSDRTDRGALEGSREESVTYVFESPGEVELPDISVVWWDIGNDTLRTIELAGLSLEVVGEVAAEPAVAANEEAAVGPSRDRWWWAAAVILAGLGLWIAVRLLRRVAEWRRAREETEPARFSLVRSALRGRDPAGISAAIMRWLDVLRPGARPARLDAFLAEYGDDETARAAAGLAAGLASGKPFAESRELARGLRRARRRLLQSRRAVRRAETLLPELNRRA